MIVSADKEGRTAYTRKTSESANRAASWIAGWLRVKASVIGAVRADGKWDQQGNPIYALKTQIVANIVNVPDRLRRPAGTAGQVQ
jgi:hypothetical protein